MYHYIYVCDSKKNLNATLGSIHLCKQSWLTRLIVAELGMNVNVRSSARDEVHY